MRSQAGKCKITDQSSPVSYIKTMHVLEMEDSLF